VQHRGVLAVNQGGDLLLRRVNNPRMAVSRAGDADARGEVQVAPVVLVEQVNTLAAGGHHAGGLLEDLGQLCHDDPSLVDC
jgi:hypothetical protein